MLYSLLFRFRTGEINEFTWNIEIKFAISSSIDIFWVIIFAFNSMIDGFPSQLLESKTGFLLDEDKKKEPKIGFLVDKSKKIYPEIGF